MNAPPQKGADRQHDGRCLEHDPGDGDDTADPAALDHQVGGLLLEQREVRRVLQGPADELAIQLPVGLGARGADRRPLAGIEGAELDAGVIGSARHDAAQASISRTRCPLADAPDGGVAAHLPEGVDAVGEQQGTGTAARCGERGFGAGMATADDDHFIGLGKSHGLLYAARTWVRNRAKIGADLAHPCSGHPPGRRPDLGYPGPGRRATDAATDPLPSHPPQPAGVGGGPVWPACRPRGSRGPGGAPDRVVRRPGPGGERTGASGSAVRAGRGPGLAATTFYTGVAPVFDRIHRDRDIVLVDQRGTGASNALTCPGSSDPDAPDSTAALTQQAQACLAALAAHANVATTPPRSRSATWTPCAPPCVTPQSISTAARTARAWHSTTCGAIRTHARRDPRRRGATADDARCLPGARRAKRAAADLRALRQRCGLPRPFGDPTARSTRCGCGCRLRLCRSACPIRSPASCAS